MSRYLIVRVRQAGGGMRELYAATAESASAAQEMLRADPAMIDAIRPSEYVDIDPDGSRTRYEVAS